MKNLIKNCKVAGSVVMLLLFISFYISNTMFYHTHLVNGSELSHSHPFKHQKSNNSPYESHSHSNSEYNYIQELNKAVWQKTSTFVADFSPVAYYCKPVSLYVPPLIVESEYTFSQLRAPPAIN
ncbi:MAG TPA: hypothetical protein PLI77_00500 [Bacteroidales bacterium]|jgi:hypothetical protein|nr:hypothetical protein [Bacteroidales bacterium]HPE39549.1 hypothetical protein [Bacteroidales bacterium]